MDGTNRVKEGLSSLYPAYDPADTGMMVLFRSNSMGITARTSFWTMRGE
jgi:hypothetical protein